MYIAKRGLLRTEDASRLPDEGWQQMGCGVAWCVLAGNDRCKCNTLTLAGRPAGPVNGKRAEMHSYIIHSEEWSCRRPQCTTADRHEITLPGCGGGGVKFTGDLSPPRHSGWADGRAVRRPPRHIKRRSVVTQLRRAHTE